MKWLVNGIDITNRFTYPDDPLNKHCLFPLPWDPDSDHIYFSKENFTNDVKAAPGSVKPSVNDKISARSVCTAIPSKVWFNPPYTTVEFTDGDKVTVEQNDFEDQRFDEYVGFCCAVVKKTLGSTTKAIECFEAAKKKAVEDSPKYKREMRRIAAKKQNEEKQRKRIQVRDMKIKEKMDELRIQKEAEKRLEEEEN